MSRWDHNSREDERLWERDDARMERKGIQSGIPILCDGMQDENNQPICDGPDIKRYHVTLGRFSGRLKQFEANYCECCANETEQFAEKVVAIGPPVRT